MNLTFADFEKHNVFRRPDWRWERAMKLAQRDGRPGRCTPADDQYVRAARAFLLCYERAGQTEDQRRLLFIAYPGVYFAYDIYRRLADEPETAYLLEARLLSGAGTADICAATGMHAEGVDWYERIFFNVRDRLQHRDWVTRQVLLPSLTRYYQTDKIVLDATTQMPLKDPAIAKPFLDATLKMFAYFGGPYLADQMISGFQAGRIATSPDELNAWLDGHWMSTVRRRSSQAAMTYKVNNYNVSELFLAHLEIMKLERSEDASGQDRTAYEKQIMAVLSDLPFSFGSSGEEIYRQRAIGPYDESAIELRDDEVVKAGHGITPDLEGYPAELPEPVKKHAAIAARQEEL